VQYLRAIAVILVVLHHSGTTNLGPFGVKIFFVISGFSLSPADAMAATYTNPDLLLFLDGIILAVIYQAHNIDNVALGLILVGLGTFLRSMGITGDLGLFESLMGPALIVAGTLALEPTLRRAPSVLLHTIGNASYSIYLSHLFFLRLSELSWRHFVGFGTSEVLEVAYVVVSFIFAIAGGVAVHYLIERPMLLPVKEKMRLSRHERND
jgi:exopolysaccharide production protein ExoZ